MPFCFTGWGVHAYLVQVLLSPRYEPAPHYTLPPASIQNEVVASAFLKKNTKRKNPLLNEVPEEANLFSWEHLKEV